MYLKKARLKVSLGSFINGHVEEADASVEMERDLSGAKQMKIHGRAYLPQRETGVIVWYKISQVSVVYS